MKISKYRASFMIALRRGGISIAYLKTLSYPWQLCNWIPFVMIRKLELKQVTFWSYCNWNQYFIQDTRQLMQVFDTQSHPIKTRWQYSSVCTVFERHKWTWIGALENIGMAYKICFAQLLTDLILLSSAYLSRMVSPPGFWVLYRRTQTQWILKTVCSSLGWVPSWCLKKFTFPGYYHALLTL